MLQSGDMLVMLQLVPRFKPLPRLDLSLYDFEIGQSFVNYLLLAGPRRIRELVSRKGGPYSERGKGHMSHVTLDSARPP